jgi:SNF2 family DNA or RNA helicase
MKLHDYQKASADFIEANPAAFLALPVGMGKTASTLTAIKNIDKNEFLFRVLVIAPKRVAEHVWKDERDLWSPDVTLAVACGTPTERMRAVNKCATITVIGRDNVTWLVDTFAKKWPFTMLVIDESQGFKDASSKRFKALKKVRHLFDRVVLLSATPASEGLLGLWSQSFLLDGGDRLGKSFTAYKQAYFQPDYMGWNWELAKGAEQKIFKRISDIWMSLKAEDYLTLPDRIDNVVPVWMSDTELETYRQLEKDYLLPIADGQPITAVNAAVLWGKLHQLAGGAIYNDDKDAVPFSTAKLEALADLVESANGSPVLVFYGYRHEIGRIQQHIKGAELIDVDKWNQGKQKVALAHAESCGAGLNLQHGGSIAVWYSIPASLGQYIQACGRLHRQGQKNTVVIHHLIVKDTIDEDVMQALRDKANTQDRLIAALKRRLTRG